jgi:hypothetical protein
LSWLILERWDAGAYIEAALLRDSLHDPDQRPRTPIVRVAALRGTPAFAAAFTDAALDCPDGRYSDAEVPTLAVVGLAELLSGVDVGAPADVLDGLKVLDLGPPWDELVDAIDGYFGTVPSGRFPMAMVRADAEIVRHEEELASAWLQLGRRLARAGQVGFRFEGGKKTVRELFRPEGHFGAMETAAADRDAGRLRHLLAASELADLDRLLDRATAVAAPQSELLVGGQRHNYLNRLREAVNAAQTVLNLANAGRDRTSEAAAPAAREVAGVIHQALTQVQQMGSRVEEPERRLLATALRPVETVARWVTR